jgi:hypothetical protein
VAAGGAETTGAALGVEGAVVGTEGADGLAVCGAVVGATDGTERGVAPGPGVHAAMSTTKINSKRINTNDRRRRQRTKV